MALYARSMSIFSAMRVSLPFPLDMSIWYVNFFAFTGVFSSDIEHWSVFLLYLYYSTANETCLKNKAPIRSGLHACESVSYLLNATFLFLTVFNSSDTLCFLPRRLL